MLTPLSIHTKREQIDPMRCEDMLGQLPGDLWVAARGVTVHFGAHTIQLSLLKRGQSCVDFATVAFV